MLPRIEKGMNATRSEIGRLCRTSESRESQQNSPYRQRSNVNQLRPMVILSGIAGRHNSEKGKDPGILSLKVHNNTYALFLQAKRLGMWKFAREGQQNSPCFQGFETDSFSSVWIPVGHTKVRIMERGPVLLHLCRSVKRSVSSVRNPGGSVDSAHLETPPDFQYLCEFAKGSNSSVCIPFGAADDKYLEKPPDLQYLCESARG